MKTLADAVNGRKGEVERAAKERKICFQFFCDKNKEYKFCATRGVFQICRKYSVVEWEKVAGSSEDDWMNAVFYLIDYMADEIDKDEKRFA